MSATVRPGPPRLLQRSASLQSGLQRTGSSQHSVYAGVSYGSPPSQTRSLEVPVPQTRSREHTPLLSCAPAPWSLEPQCRASPDVSNSLRVPLGGISHDNGSAGQIAARPSPMRHSSSGVFFRGASVTAAPGLPSGESVPQSRVCIQSEAFSEASTLPPTVSARRSPTYSPRTSLTHHTRLVSAPPPRAFSSPPPWASDLLLTAGADSDPLGHVMTYILSDVDKAVGKVYQDFKEFTESGLRALGEQINHERTQREKALQQTAAMIETVAETVDAATARVDRCFEMCAESHKIADATQKVSDDLCIDIRTLQGAPRIDGCESPGYAAVTEMESLELSMKEIRSNQQQQAEGLEEMWLARQRTGARINELVGGIEEVATALSAKEIALWESIEAMQGELSAVASNAKKNSPDWSLSEFPLLTVKEDGEEASGNADCELFAIRSCLEALQGQVSQLRACTDSMSARDVAKASQVIDKGSNVTASRVDGTLAEVLERAAAESPPPESRASSESFDARAVYGSIIEALTQLRGDVTHYTQDVVQLDEKLSMVTQGVTSGLSGELLWTRNRIIDAESKADEAMRLVASLIDEQTSARGLGASASCPSLSPLMKFRAAVVGSQDISLAVQVVPNVAVDSGGCQHASLMRNVVADSGERSLGAAIQQGVASAGSSLTVSPGHQFRQLQQPPGASAVTPLQRTRSSIVRQSVAVNPLTRAVPRPAARSLGPPRQ